MPGTAAAVAMLEKTHVTALFQAVHDELAAAEAGMQERLIDRYRASLYG